LSANANALISKYLQEAVAAEKSFETQLRGFSLDGDDEEVRAAFDAQAESSHTRAELLAGQLEKLGDAPSETRSSLAAATENHPALNRPEVMEERIVQNIIAAYSMAAAGCALYQVLGTISGATADAATEALVRKFHEEEAVAAGQIWHLLPSRSKIAFNMLTIAEVDPAVETRAVDNRVVE
jgi:ferritin-like metal-binding protein YciE